MKLKYIKNLSKENSSASETKRKLKYLKILKKKEQMCVETVTI